MKTMKKNTLGINAMLIATMLIAAMLFVSLTTSCASTGGGEGAAGSAGLIWSFANPANDVQGWELASSEFYQYRGEANLSYDDTTFGKGLLRLDVDFTETSHLDWSEPKIKNDFPRAFNMRNVSIFAFDFYYNPSLLNEGNFKPKIFTNNNGILVDVTGMAIEDGWEEEFENGFVRQEVIIFIPRVAGFMTDMRFSIAGSLTDYKGPVFFDNMRFE